MIALILAAIFGWSSPCFAFSAHADPAGGYVQGIGFAAPVGAPHVWSTQPLSMTVTYADHTDSAPISLRQSFALVEQDGEFATRAPAPYTIYLCEAGKRPSVMYLPILVSFLSLS